VLGTRNLKSIPWHNCDLFDETNLIGSTIDTSDYWCYHWENNLGSWIRMCNWSCWICLKSWWIGTLYFLYKWNLNIGNKIKFINMCRILWCGVYFNLLSFVWFPMLVHVPDHFIYLLYPFFFSGYCTHSQPCDICSICRLTKHYLLIFLPNRTVFHWEVFLKV
jgi:hypothetical protein